MFFYLYSIWNTFLWGTRELLILLVAGVLNLSRGSGLSGESSSSDLSGESSLIGESNFNEELE